MKPIDVSIIIVNYNTADMLRDCLNSVYEKTQACHFEIIVVDNASKDNSVDMLRGEFPSVVLVASNDNNGFSKGNNLALPLAKGNYIFYLNPDTILLNDAVSLMHRFLTEHPDAGLVGPRLFRNLERVHHPTIRQFTTPKNIMFRFSPGFQHFQKFSERVLLNKSKTRPVDWLMGAALMGPTTLLKEAGGFDEVFFMYSEEEDLSRRLKQKGYKTYYCSDAEIVHLWGGSSRKSPTISNQFFWNSQMIYLLRYNSQLKVKIFVKMFTAMLNIKSLFSQNDKKPYFEQIKEIVTKHCP